MEHLSGNEFTKFYAEMLRDFIDNNYYDTDALLYDIDPDLESNIKEFFGDINRFNDVQEFVKNRTRYVYVNYVYIDRVHTCI